MILKGNEGLMARSKTYEEILLEKAETFLSKHTSSFEERICLLEACAAFQSKIDINEYWSLCNITGKSFDNQVVQQLSLYIEESSIPYAMAISSLSREPLSLEDKKEKGVFYTDFRLASFIASTRAKDLTFDSKVVDFAAGTGILLVALAIQYKQIFPKKIDYWLEKNLYAFDLSKDALRGCAAALLSIASNAQTVVQTARKWSVGDSLLRTESTKFDIIVGNPPWGKIKLTRHFFEKKTGKERVYGSNYEDFDNDQYSLEKQSISNYSKSIKEKFNLSDDNEPDFYMAFLQKAFFSANSIVGKISMLVPAGLIRSQGTSSLRKYIFDSFSNIEFDLLDNKGRFFSIDSRFKFLLLSVDNNPQKKNGHFILNRLSVKNNRIIRGNDITFDINQLKAVRPDTTIPEVNNEKELSIFFKVYENGMSWGNDDNQWKVDISRELDMTADKDSFSTRKSKGFIPVIEGRMVQQHRFGAKSYVSGSGRSAVWTPCQANAHAQFFINPKKLKENLQKRISKIRVGFCDIAGQTNERSMMSAIIPQNVICGNKVPTILFPNTKNNDILYLWVGITNSFVFDWMIRRIISTTINYFLLFSIPMPSIDIDSSTAKKIIEKTKTLSQLKGDFYTSEKMQLLRMEIDILVAQTYGLDFADLKIILDDFPLLDKKQPSIDSEKKSSITKDLVLANYALGSEKEREKFKKRLIIEKRIKARAFIPTEMSHLCQKEISNNE